MEVSVEHRPEKSEAVLKISADGKEFSRYLQAAAEELSKERELPGFRPGKAPVDVVRKAFGDERLINEAAAKAVPQYFVTAVLDEGVEAIAQPKVVVESAGVESGISFTATVPVLPKVTLGDVSSVTIEKRTPEVSDEDVEKELTYLAKTRSTMIDVARPAQDGDTVTVDFLISLDGAPMEGGESKNHPIHLGEGHFVADFEKHLLGISAGDAREFTITFPDDYGREELRGKQAEAKVKAHAVQKRMLPDIDDAFAKQLGDFKDVAALKSSLKGNLLREREDRERERFQGELMQKLAEVSEFSTIPEALLDKEIDRRIEELQQMLTVQQKTLADYLAGQQKTLEQIRAEMRPVAERSVKVGLALRAFSEREAIAVDDEAVTKRTDEYLKRFATSDEAKKSINPDDLKENITNMLRNQKALKQLEALVTVTEADDMATKSQKDSSGA